jgi:hypothetical protein
MWTSTRRRGGCITPAIRDVDVAAATTAARSRSHGKAEKRGRKRVWLTGDQHAIGGDHCY